MQAGGRRFDPDWLHQYLARPLFGCVAAHTKIDLKPTGAEAGVVFFENVNE